MRFEREAAVVTTLSSPHVVRILEVSSREAELPYLAMERLTGGDLSAVLERRIRLSPSEAADLAIQVAQGLEEARARGVVHRDIKPKNLFQTQEGLWKILDFGIASLAGDPIATSRDELAGTPAYMAPEQIDETIASDHRIDVHALAAVLYRALTGRTPFSGGDRIRTLHHVLHELPVRPSRHAEVPRAVEDVLLIGLAKRPADRFDSALELARALRAAAEGTHDDGLTARASELARRQPWSG